MSREESRSSKGSVTISKVGKEETQGSKNPSSGNKEAAP